MAPQRTSKRQTSLCDRPRITKRPRKTQLSMSRKLRFSFFELPAELRRNIYDQVINDSSLTLSRNKGRGLALTSTLARVNRQIRTEFLPLALETTSVVKTEVRNWDFGHIISFLNRISDDEIESFGSDRRIVVEFRFSGENADPSGLTRWLDRFGDERRGSDIVFEYKCTNQAHVRQNWKVAGFRACTVGGPSGRRQFEKIEEEFVRQDPMLRDV